MNSKYPSVLVLLILVALGAGGLAAYFLFTKKVQVVIETQGNKGDTHVKLGDEELGTTDSSGSMFRTRRLTREKSYRISFSHPNFKVVPRDTTLVVDDRSEWKIQLRLAGGRIEIVVNTQPSTIGAKIQIDGDAVGETGADGSWRGEIGQKDGPRHVYVVGPQGQREWETRQALTDATGPLIAELGVPLGARLLLRTAHKVSGVEVLVGGQSMGKTDSIGNASIAIPTARQGQKLGVTFNYPGGNIADWNPNVPRTPARISHEIKIRPTTPPEVQLGAVADNNAPAQGIGLLVNRKRVGVTDASGSARANFSDVLIGQTVRIGVTVPENLVVISVTPQRITIGTDQQTYAVRAVFDIAKFVVIRTTEQGAPINDVDVYRKDRGETAIGKTKNGGELRDRVARLGQSYDYELKKTGYMTVKKSIAPSGPETNLGVKMEPFAFTMVVNDRARSTTVSGVAIYAANNLGRALANTDVSGRATISGWGDLGNHKLVLKKDMYHDAAVEISLNQNNQEVPALIDPIPPQLILRFRAEGTSDPIKNAAVVILKPTSLRGTTDSDGQVLIESPGLAVGQTYEGEIQYLGFAEPFAARLAQHVTSIVFDVPLVSDITLEANEAGAVLKIYNGSQILIEGTGSVNIQLPPNPSGYRVWGQVSGTREEPYDQLHFFNQMVVHQIIPVVTWYKKGMAAFDVGNRDEAKTYFVKVEPDDRDYGRAQIKVGEFALEKRKNASGDLKQSHSSDAVEAFENAWDAIGEWKYNPYFAHRNMTLNYELDRFDQAKQWFYRLQQIGLYKFDPTDMPDMLVNSYLYEALMPLGQYEKEIVPQGGDPVAKGQLRQAWRKFATIVKNQKNLPVARKQFYEEQIQHAENKIAVMD